MKFQKRQSLGETYITSSLLQNNGGFLTNFGFNFQTLELIDKISIIKLGLLANTKITRHTTRPNHGHFDPKVCEHGLHKGPISHLKSWRHQHSHDTICGVRWHLEGLYGVFSYVGKKTASCYIYIYIYIILFIYLFIPWYFLWRYGGLGNKQNHIFFEVVLHSID
jgi:hypothetical protein